jgi:hypothetical protein
MTEPIAARAALVALLAREANQTVAAPARAMSDAIVARHKDCLIATLFYGSCLRPAGDNPDSVGPGAVGEQLMDFYAVVDNLRRANGGTLAAAGNRLLPPNVFYLEVPYDGTRLRCKYAVVTLAQLGRLVRADTLQNYFWGRFCQPTAVPFARGAGTRDKLAELLADAVTTMVGATAPLFGAPFTARDLWVRALAESYGAELRPESAARPAQVHDANAARYATLTAPALAAAGFTTATDADGRFAPVAGPRARRRSRRAWMMRRLLGKTLNVLRLLKAVFTFEGGADYVAWKIQRHSGVRLDMSDWQRRHPLLASPVLALRYWRKSAFR